MAIKNADLLVALQALELKDTTPSAEKKKLFEALDVLMKVDLSLATGDEATNGAGLFRKAVIDYKVIFPQPQRDAIFTGAVANDPNFLHPNGNGGDDNLRVLQRLAAEKRIEFSLKGSQDNADKQAVLKALAEANSDDTLRAALVTPAAKKILGDLSLGYKWGDGGDPLMPAESLSRIQELVAEIQTAPIKRQVEELAATIGPFGVDATVAINVINGGAGANPNNFDKDVVQAYDNLVQMEAKLKALKDYRTTQDDVLDRHGNSEKKDEIDALVREEETRFNAAKALAIAEYDNLVAIVDARRIVIEAKHTDNSAGNFAGKSLAEITTARNEAQAAYEAITKAIKLIQLNSDADASAAEAHRVLAEAALNKLNILVYQKSAAKHTDAVAAAKTAFDDLSTAGKPLFVAVKPDGGKKWSPEQYVEAYKKRDNARGAELDKAEKLLEQLAKELTQAQEKLALETPRASAESTNAVAAIQAAYTAAEANVKLMRPLVKANLRMQTNDDDYSPFHSHGFDVGVVKKGSPLLTGAAPAPDPAAVLLQNGVTIESYKGVRLRDDQVIRSTERFHEVANPDPKTNTRQPLLHNACVGTLEQEKSGKVSNVTPQSETAKMSDYQKSILAMRQAKMLLNNYDPKKGPIHIYGSDPKFAQMVCGALVAQKGNLNIEIRSHVPGCQVPTKAGLLTRQASADAAFIGRCGITKEVVDAGGDTKKYTAATQTKREDLAKMRAAWFNKDDKRAAADKGELHVDQTETLDTKGKMSRTP